MPAYTYQESIAALFVGAMGHGMYLCTLAYALRWQIFTDQGWKVRKRIYWPILCATLTLCVLSSTHLGLAALLTVEWANNAVAHVPTTDKVTWPATVMCAAANSSVLIADGILIHRCWAVCSKSLRAIVFPAAFWLGAWVCTGLQIYYQVVKGTDNTTAWTFVNMSIGPGTVLTPFWASTIIINLYTTARIVRRIYKAAESQRQVHGTTHDLRFVIRVLLDSGMLYLFVTVPHFIVWWTPNSAGAILLLAWLNLPVVGSAFNLIIIRTSQHRAIEDQRLENDCMVSEMQFHYPTRKDADIDSTTDSERIIHEMSGTTVSVGSGTTEV